MAETIQGLVGSATVVADKTINGALRLLPDSLATEVVGQVASAALPSLAAKALGRINPDALALGNKVLAGDASGIATDLAAKALGRVNPETLRLASEVFGGSVGGIVGAALNKTVAGKPLRAVNKSVLSQWGEMSELLFAQIVACDAKGVPIPDSPVVVAPATDMNFEATLNWQSPFENSGAETKAPALMALIQSGQLSAVVTALQGRLPEGVSASLDDTKASLNSLEGRTGISKLNSRQVFSGMPPVKIPVTLHFRAVSNPRLEVSAPYQQLLAWALPRKLADDGLAKQLIENVNGVESLVKALFPSEAPTMVAVRHGGNVYAPMVIEAISRPLDSPLSESGHPLYLSVQLTLSTLTALDANDAVKVFRV